jgi:fatty acid desaturase
MKLLKIKLKIFLTNWINVVGIAIALNISILIGALLEMQSIDHIPKALTTTFIGCLFLITYGLIYWVGLMIVMFFLDFILMNNNKKHLKSILYIQWAVISTPFMCLALGQGDWKFLIVVIMFSVTQFFRGKQIAKMIESDLVSTFV